MVERVVGGEQVVFADYGEELLRLSDDGLCVWFFDGRKEVLLDGRGTIYRHFGHVLGVRGVSELLVYLDRFVREGKLFDVVGGEWVGFWFEGNQWCGWVRCVEDWLEVRKAYCDWSLDELLDKGRRADVDGKVVFGVRGEHVGGSLREFFVRCGMRWD